MGDRMPSEPARRAGRTGPRGRCAACGVPVDVLRAPAVRMTAGGLLVYCSALHRELPPRAVESLVPTPGRSKDAAPVEVDLLEGDAADSVQAGLSFDAPREELGSETPTSADSVVVPASTTLGSLTKAPAPTKPRMMVLVWTALILLLAAIFAFEWSRGRSGAAVLVLTGVVALWAVLSQRLGVTLGRDRDAERSALGARLGLRGRRVRDQELSWVSVWALRPGEGVLVEAGEHVPCDGVVLQGEGSVVPFPDAPQQVSVEQGLRLPAGALLVSGTMHVVCTAAGADRTFHALYVGQRSRETWLARVSRSVRFRVAPAVGVFSFVFGTWLSGSWLVGTIVALANFASLASPLCERLITILQDTWLFVLARQGVDFGTDGLDAAGHVQMAVFCARGTFLAGEPEVTDIVGLGGAAEADVLALAAGAESVATHPAAASIRRAAHDRHVAPEPTRGHDVLGGMGVTCYSADGHRVLVGTRELMMKEKISIALSEEELRKMEQRGRSGILVARAGRLLGLLALHDALRRGARAAVQLLLDVHIEPVLLSGEARNATEALGRALSIEHVRPEVPARERAAEVRRVIEGGAAVAVVGHSPLDDSALSAASVPVVLDGSALTPRARSVTLLGDEVLSAAHALVAAQMTRRDGLSALVLCMAPAGLGVLCTTSLLFPPVVAPLGALLGGLAAAAWVWSRLERARAFQQKLPKGLSRDP